VDQQAAVETSDRKLMRRFAPIVVFTALFSAATAVAQQQTMVPPASPTIGASGGFSAGLALPLGRLGDTHGAGYAISALVDFSAADQPFSFRAELNHQRFDVKSTAPVGVRNQHMWSLGGSLLARKPRGASSAFGLGGIGIYRATGEKVKPGVTVGGGLEVPLTFFVGIADIRVHYVLTEKKPLVTIPITLGARF
jgi:hypothetical protein